MDALNQSDELMLRSRALMARAKQARVTAAEKGEESRQLIAAAHASQAAMLRACRVELARGTVESHRN